MAIGAAARLRAGTDGHHALCARHAEVAITQAARIAIRQLAR
jgi:hypothetical protein